MEYNYEKRRITDFKVDANYIDSSFIDSLTYPLDDYQKFVDIHTSNKVPYEMKAMWAASGLVSEAGEVMAEFEKGIRKGDYENRRDKILEELGDVLWYAAALANALDVNLEKVFVNNCYKLEDRVEANRS